MSFIEEELTAARTRIRDLEQQLEVINATCTTLRNLLQPAMLVASSPPVDPRELSRWLAELPGRIAALPPPLHLGRKGLPE